VEGGAGAPAEHCASKHGVRPMIGRSYRTCGDCCF
jgi:hypothetical protein